MISKMTKSTFLRNFIVKDGINYGKKIDACIGSKPTGVDFLLVVE